MLDTAQGKFKILFILIYNNHDTKFSLIKPDFPDKCFENFFTFTIFYLYFYIDIPIRELLVFYACLEI